MHNVLIVEDEKSLSRALKLKLDHNGFNASIAEDGQQALAILGKEKISMILLDLMMPNMDGFELLTKLKEQGNKIPVVVLSNLGQKEDQDRALALGAKGYFIKADTLITDIVEYVKKTLGA